VPTGNNRLPASFKMVQTRNFIVTNYHLNTEQVYEQYKDQIRFIAYGDEICPTTQRKHHQVYLHMFNKKATGKRSLNAIGQLFGGAYVAAMRGNFKQNEAYCSKESELIKLGDEPKQGLRGDLNETTELIRNGELTIDEVLVNDPHMVHQYGRTLAMVEDNRNQKQFRKWMTKGIWYWGETGVGKSHKAFKDFDPATHYVKPLEEEWWDGYRGQETVIFNEYRNQFQFSYLLSLMDKWPMYVRRRNRQPVPFMAKLIIFTSSQPPEESYHNIYNGLDGPKRFRQFRRRCRVRELIQFNSKEESDEQDSDVSE